MIFNINKGILGLNARNLLYVNKFNQKSAINFANSKLKTKHFLSARGIPVPKLYRVVKSHEDLNKLDFGTLPGAVVIKPNMGSQGKGIIPFKSRKGYIFTTVSDKQIDVNEIKQHIIDIIDGRYSMGNIKDTAFFEQLIINHRTLAKYTWAGLPDIRVIMHNLVPVMAMLRLPTKESGGRANLSQGALGIGLDIATGRPTHINYKTKIINEIPDFGKFDADFKVPFWDEILNICAKSQYITNLGFLGCDIAIDNNNGPILIEINARPGTKIQIANKAPLAKRLKKVTNLNVQSPEKGVRLGKDLFGLKDTITKFNKNLKIINTEEDIELMVNSKKINIKAKIDLNIERSILDKKLQTDNKKNTVKITIQGKHKIVISPKYEELNDGFGCILGSKDLQNFLVKPKSSNIKTISQNKSNPTIKNNLYYLPQIDYGQVDYQIFQVTKKIKLLKKLTPVNLKEEISKFKENNSYNPQFLYDINIEDFTALHDILKNIKVDDSPLGQIFQNKIDEFENTLRVIEHIGTDNFSHFSEQIFPIPTQQHYEKALILKTNKKKYKVNKQILSDIKTAKVFSDFLKNSDLDNWKVVLKENMIADCSVNKDNTIFIKKGSKFHETRVKKLIAHEIETHIFTAENGKRQPYKIFQYGTAKYLKTQEGLAIYNQEKVLGYENDNHYYAADNLLSCYICLNNSFSESYQILTTQFNQKPKNAIQNILKSKRGLGDTSQNGGFAKQAIYTLGALEIEKFVESGENLSDLYIGKITTDINDLCKKIKSLNPPIYLPSWYN